MKVKLCDDRKLGFLQMTGGKNSLNGCKYLPYSPKGMSDCEETKHQQIIPHRQINDRLMEIHDLEISSAFDLD